MILRAIGQFKSCFPHEAKIIRTGCLRAMGSDDFFYVRFIRCHLDLVFECRINHKTTTYKNDGFRIPYTMNRKIDCRERDDVYNPQLETFLRVADAGSFSKAAGEAYITPTAVIKQINLLEESLGVKLFDRSHRGPFQCAVSVQHPQAAKKRLCIEDLYGENLLMMHRGWSHYVDQLRDELWQHHPQIHIVDFDFYSMDVFNRCANPTTCCWCFAAGPMCIRCSGSFR